MSTHWKYTLQRFEVFLRDVLEPAVFPQRVPLEAHALQTQEPISVAEAMAGFRKASHGEVAARPVKVGWQWGPRWSTCWFRLRGRVTREMMAARGPLREWLLRFSTDTEALLWKTPEGVPWHGLDVNRSAVRLPTLVRAGGGIELYVEAACNHLFGDRGLQWDIPDTHARWNSETPGRLELCELALRDESVWMLARLYSFALDLARQMPPDSARGQELLGALRRATNAIPDTDVARAAAARGEAMRELREVLGRAAGGSATLCHAVGHAHIDTAWLWPIRETKRKCLRTFSTVLRNMERYPEYRFLCSQAQQYAWVEERSPLMFAQIKKRVAEGRWEPGGGMWVEPDCTCPSGESLVRQMLHADRYWRSRFGDARGKQRHLYLPDTFGFPGTLPQLMKQAGLDTFITNKLHWNQTNAFPHTTFIWRGVDGSEVLAHVTPGKDYNATNTPAELRRGEATHANKDVPSVGEDGKTLQPARWLQPYGFGDGGGGPTDWSIEYATLAKDCDGLPRVKHTTATEFCDALHMDAAAAAKRGDPLPVWEGELYLEMHRGTYTTHARLKQSNQQLEEMLRLAELLLFAGPPEAGAREPKEGSEFHETVRALLDKAWKLLLLNQFHDILPGSSISWVYEDAARDHAEVRRIATELIEAGQRMWMKALEPPEGCKKPVVVFNPGSTDIDYSVIDMPKSDGSREPLWLKGTRALGALIIDAQTSRKIPEHVPRAAVKQRGSMIELGNDLVRVTIDRAGRIASLETRVMSGRRIAGPLNQLVLYEDRPRMWDAWDVDAEYLQKPQVVDSPAGSISVVRDGPLRAAVRVERSLGARSRIVQSYELDAESTVLRIHIDIDWQEEHRFLRALFPTGIRAATARFGAPFGWVDRPTTRNTSWERAMFEVPFQRWFGVESGSGCFNVIAPDRYGASCESAQSGVTLGLSLLRSTRYPDQTADIGWHQFMYAIDCVTPRRHMPLVVERVIRPAVAHPYESGLTDARAIEARRAAVELTDRYHTLGSEDILYEAIKPSEDARGVVVVRMVAGASPVTTGSIQLGTSTWLRQVDLLERPTEGGAASLNQHFCHVSLGPTQMLTAQMNTDPASARVTPKARKRGRPAK